VRERRREQGREEGRARKGEREMGEFFPNMLFYTSREQR
jgi:hypothetical protein